MNKDRILVVDDNPKNIQLLGSILSETYEIEIALSGREAIEWVNQEHFELILLDIMMPEINGFEVCKEIRKIKKFDNVPIIFLTAKTDHDSIVMGFETGGQDYITKPFNITELLVRVKTHLELHKTKSALISSNNQLETKVKLRTEELQNKNSQLEYLQNFNNKFICYLGNELKTPITRINTTVTNIKHSAESSKLLSLTNQLEDSIKNLDLISKIATQIMQIGNSETINIKPTLLNQTIESVLLDTNSIWKDNQVELSNTISLTTKINLDKDYIRNSIIGILNTIYDSNSKIKNIDFSSQENEKYTKLNISCYPCSINTANLNTIPNSATLFYNYAELIMKLHNGIFCIKKEVEETTIFEWSFLR